MVISKHFSPKMSPGFAVVLCSVLGLHAVAQQFTDADWFSLGGIPGANNVVNAAAIDAS
jgi:hypothetical protein